MYTKRTLPGGPAFFGGVLYEDPEGRILVEVMDPGSFGTGSAIYCGGWDAAQGTGLVMLLTDALQMPDHPCALWLPLVSSPSNDYYWPGCTRGDCPDPPSAEAGTDASAEGGNVETDGAAATEAGLATDAARRL